MAQGRSCARPIACCLISLISLAIMAGAQDTKEALLAAWEANWAPVHDLEVAFEEVAGGPPVDEHGAIPRMESLFRWTDGCIYRKSTRPGVSTVETSFDWGIQESRRLYDPGRFGHVSATKDYAGGCAWAAHLLRPLGPPDSAYRSAYSDLSLMLSDERSQLRDERDEVRGRPAAVLDVYGEWESPVLTVWLDVERGGVPLKWVQLKEDGVANATIDLTDYIQVETVWLPKRIEVSFSDRYSGDPRGAGGQLVQQVLQTPDARPWIKVNSALGSDACTVNFPPGATVINEDTHEVWLARADTMSPMTDQVCWVGGDQPAKRPNTAKAWALATFALGLAGGCALRLVKGR